MAHSSFSTQQIIDLVADVITPLFKIDRTIVMPFDLKRRENVGEHSLGLALLACALAKSVDPMLDTGKIAQYAIAHDIAEIHAGDITVWESDEVKSKKKASEALAAKRILEEFPQFPWAVQTFQEYEKHDTAEKRYVYALDKLYPHLLVLIADHHPVYPTWEAYLQTEIVAKENDTTTPSMAI